MQRLLAVNAHTWHNWMAGAPAKRSLIAYHHCTDFPANDLVSPGGSQRAG